MWFGKKKDKDLEELRDIEDDVEESDYVPYACLYDHNTILTKNGELLQTIKITGLSRELLGGDAKDLREVLRTAVKNHIPNDSFAIWLHTIRREQDVMAGGIFSNDFANRLNSAWATENRFHKQYINEVYISIAIEGQDARITNPTVFMRGLLPWLDVKWRLGYIGGIHERLNDVVEKLLADLEPYGAKRLGLYEEQGVFYSEQMRFLEQLINLVDRPMPVAMEDLSTYLTSGDVTFSYNAMEVRTAEGRRRFGTILTLKEYKEASLRAIDKFLLLPMEFVVTQCVNFVNPEVAFSSYKQQKYYFDIGGAQDLAKLSEVDRILNGSRGKPNDFGEQQISIFLLADSMKQLEFNVRSTVKFLGEHGLVTVREDLKFEECYWAQLPGNFIFVNRMAPTDTLHVGGFANLSNYPVGSRKSEAWGEAVTTFHTANGTPYFFNFHYGSSGHTSIIGPGGSGKSVLMHFLLTQATKYSPHIFYFDSYGSGGNLARTLGGDSIDVSPHAAQPLFNLFWLESTENNRSFLLRLFSVMARAAGGTLSPEDKSALQQAIDRIYQLSAGERSLSTYTRLLMEAAPSAAQALSAWSGAGRYANLFGNTNPAPSFARIQAFNIQHLAEEPMVFAAAVSFLTQWVTTTRSQEPTILVFNDAWNTLKMSHVAERMDAWLDYLTGKNTLCIFAAEDPEQAAAEPMTASMFPKIATQFFLPDSEPTEAYRTVFGMNDIEFAYLEAMDTDQRHFLLKQGGTSIVAELNLQKMGEFLGILSGKTTSGSNELQKARAFA
ncbi:MAG: hypothetical protein U1E36_06640 [Rickettsiales bacterium]